MVRGFHYRFYPHSLAEASGDSGWSELGRMLDLLKTDD
jgi:hypothetical protein